MAKATVVGLKSLRRPEDVARDRGKTITEVLPWRAPAPVEETEPFEQPILETAEAIAGEPAEPAAETNAEPPAGDAA
jgi:hypothetical protein